jgi:hypothetical protein
LDCFGPRARRRGAPPRRRRTVPIRCRLEVGRLEDRCLPSVQVLATLGDQVPGIGYRINDFEPNGLNNHGDVLYGDDLGAGSDPSTFFGEGIFLRRHGQETPLAYAGAPAPGGGTYDASLFYGPAALNDAGDVAFTFQLAPFMLPFGVNGGTYRYSQSTGTVTPVVRPFVTPAPGGGTFQGTVFAPTINNRGDLLFDGIVPTDQGVHVPGEDYVGLGEGIFQADQSGHIASVVSPGDAAPGGGTFDWAGGPWVNDGGDVAFEAHVAGEPASAPGPPPQAFIIGALNSAYVKDGATGRITSVAHAGAPAPGGGIFQDAYSAEINNAGDLIFISHLTPDFAAAGLFRYSQGVVTPVARPGDAMPGGGHLVSVSQIAGSQVHINNRGDIVFTAALDTDGDGDGLPDTGLYQWSHGAVSLLARTGTVLPGAGTIEGLVSPAIIIGPVPEFTPTGGAINNDRGQVLFSATLTDGRGVLLLDTPGERGSTFAARASQPPLGALPVSGGATPAGPAVAPGRANGAGPIAILPASGACLHRGLEAVLDVVNRGDTLGATPGSAAVAGGEARDVRTDSGAPEHSPGPPRPAADPFAWVGAVGPRKRPSALLADWLADAGLAAVEGPGS